MERDFYQVLGVMRTATSDEIRATYVRLVKRHHPDVAGRLPNRLRDVQQAYRCLVDADLRAQHDQRIVESERAHHAQQYLVQRQLGRYDSRLRKRPLSIRQQRWRTVLTIAIGVGLVVRMLLGLL